MQQGEKGELNDKSSTFDGPKQAIICMHEMLNGCEELAVFRGGLHVTHVLLCIAVGNGSYIIV